MTDKPKRPAHIIPITTNMPTLSEMIQHSKLTDPEFTSRLLQLLGPYKPASTPRSPNLALVAMGSVADLCKFDTTAELRAFIESEGLSTLMHSQGMLYRSGLFAVMAARNAQLRSQQEGKR